MAPSAGGRFGGAPESSNGWRGQVGQTKRFFQVAVRSRRHRRQGQTRWRTGRGREGCVRRSAGNSGLSEAWQHARAQGAAKPRAIRARGASRHGPERFIWRARSAETAGEQKALWLRVSQESGVGPRARFRQEIPVTVVVPASRLVRRETGQEGERLRADRQASVGREGSEPVERTEGRPTSGRSKKAVLGQCCSLSYDKDARVPAKTRTGLPRRDDEVR
jgi:hypothetical protein